MASFEIVSPKHGVFTVLVDQEDLDSVLSFGAWHVTRTGRKTKSFRVSAYVRGSGRLNHKRMSLHEFIMGTKGIDHFNGNQLDNRRENLRVLTQAQNSQNMGVSARSKSGLRGVTWSESRQKWCAHLRINGRSTNLGRYDSKDAAAEACRKARELNMPFVNEARCARAQA
jgi:hypothetical protein